MNDQIWFIYLTDHHEGPFTPAEVAAKVAQGAVTAQSLGWKDGMAEWIPIESIPELASALSGPAPESAPPNAAPAGGEENFSLAQLLAQQQSGGAPPISEEPSISNGLTGNASVLSSMVDSVQAAHPLGTGSVILDAGGSGASNMGAAPVNVAPVSPDEEVWTLKIGAQVSGLHSLNRLKALAGEGEIPPDAQFWRPGWQDFQPMATVPEVASARRVRKSPAGIGGSGQRLGGGQTGSMARPGLVPITAGANVGDDEPTDPNMRVETQEKGFKGILARIKRLTQRKSPAKAAVAKPAFGAVKKSGGLGKSIKQIAMLVGALLVIGGGAAAYFIFFSSPIPSDLDVIADDLESMQGVVKVPEEEGRRLYLALARGTEDNPADDTAPKFYVASNLPEGTNVSLSVTGQPGTLVNRLSFEKTFNATVGKNQIAVFESVQDDGKPLAMGEYVLKITAEGAEPLQVERFLGGRKGGPYQDRLKRYKERLQAEYDKEMQELREVIDTMKSLQADVSKRTADYKTNWAVPTNRARILADWKAFILGAAAMANQLDTRLKARTTAATQTFHPRAFEDVAQTLGQLQQLIQMHTARLEGLPPSGGNPDEIEGLVEAGVVSLEQFLSQALVKSPFDVLSIDNVPGAAPVAPTGAPAAP